MKFLTVLYSPVPSPLYFLPLWPKYLPRHPILENTQPLFLPRPELTDRHCLYCTYLYVTFTMYKSTWGKCKH